MKSNNRRTACSEPRPAERPLPTAYRLPPTAKRNGFTLVELLVVMVIIGIILTFILNASIDAQRRAEERATQALITKLDAALNDRIEALALTQPNPTQAHKLIAGVFPNGYPYGVPPYISGTAPNYQPGIATARSQVIAWFDYMKSELPDVFYVQNTTGPYPFNFASNSFPGTPTDPNSMGNVILPLGNSIQPPFGNGNGNLSYSLFNDFGSSSAGTGIYGASYAAAAGLFKNLGYLPTGYDMVDNNGNGLIDEWAEGVNSSNQALVQARLGNHQHATARSEMLYAILVEGLGPLGSAFRPDDFTDREVQDTDGDGLPEFVDAWGKPLQFFRWPVLYHSDLQRGQVIEPTSENSWAIQPPYYLPPPATMTTATIQAREQDPMDLNRQLVAPAWWSIGYNTNSPLTGVTGTAGTVGASQGVNAFEYYFRKLTEPYPNGGAGGTYFWDRGAYGGRREFYTKFLVLSGGRDGTPGVFIYPDATLAATSNPSWALIVNENSAMPVGLDVADFTQNAQIQATAVSSGFSYDLIQAAQDDITNHNIQVTVGIGGG